MLHCSILPAHREFARLLANLKLVVVDEGHAYRGVFGAHTACVLRRLQRLCHLVYGSSPVLVMTSATIGNPKAHAQALLGVKDVTLVDRDTSPCGPKAFVLWNPPLTAMSQAMSRRAAATAQQGQAQQEVAPAEVEALRADALARKQQAAAVDAVCRAAAHVDGERAECVKQPPQGATPARTDEAAMGSCCPHDVAVGAAASDGASVEPAAAASAPAPSAAEMRRLTELRRASERKISAIINRSTVDPRGPGPQAASPGQRPLVRFNASRLHGELAAQGDTPQLAQAIAQVSTRLQAKAAALGDWKEAKALISSDGEARRVSPMVEISQVLAECVQHGARTIAFCKTRKLSELVTVYTREILQGVDPGLAAKVKVYRGGYAPEDRRRLEAALHSGALLAVCATNALELGVDIGGLDVTLHLGFPGTLASLRQQAGRAGRREQPSLAVYVAFDGPLDQYFIHNPEQLFAKPVEHAQVDPSNAHILQQHLMCAAAELPIHLDVDAQYFGPGLLPAAQALVARSLMGRHPRALGGASGGLHYTGPRDSPAATISLRAIDPHRFTIINEADGSVKEEIEASMAFFEVYDGAIYMHQGRTYLCKRLDVQAQQAIVRPVDVKYYTVVVDITDVHVCGGRLAYPLAPPAAAGEGLSVMFGEAVVSVCFQGFSRVWQGSNIPFDYVDLWLPNACYDTQATWVDVPAAARLECQAAGLSVREGCHGAGHAVLNVLPLLLMAGPSDMATDCDHPHDTRRREERVLLYDKHPGGIGLALQAAALLPDMLQRAHKLVIDCPCTSASGCPCCVQHAACKHYNVAMSKPATEVVLRHLLLVQGQQLTAAVQPSAAAGATQ